MNAALRSIGALAVAVAFAGGRQPLPAQSVTVAGTVVDSAGRPIPFATVSVVETAASIGADRQGGFRVTRLTPGSYQFRVRAIGYVPASFAVTVGPGGRRGLSLALRPAVQQMTDLTVSGESPRMAAGLYRRLLRGGQVVTGDVMTHRGMMRPSEGLRWIPGVEYEDRPISEGGAVVRFPGCSGARHRVGIWVDGFQSPPDNQLALENLDFVRPSEVELMEVYKRYDQIPPEFREPDLCAAILVWTVRSVVR